MTLAAPPRTLGRVTLGLDARKLWDGGIGTYIRELLAGLARRPDAPPLVVLARDAEAADVRRLAPGASCVRVSAGLYSIAEHVALPRAARAAGVTLYHAPHYTLPIGWRGAAVVTIHDLIHLRFPGFFPPGAALYARGVAGNAARRARVVMTDSEAVRRDVIERLGIAPERVRAVPLGVSAAFRPRPAAEVERFRRARGLPADFLLYVGARKRHKNLELLFRALARMRETERPPLVLSGAPWAFGDPNARGARAAGVETQVRFSGPLAGDDEMALLYSAAKLYVHPALTEGFGLPPLEAMACGVPVLSSDGGALPEVLGDAAEMLPPSDPEAWADAMVRLLGDPARRQALVTRGHARAQAMTWSTMVERVLQVYREAAANGCGR